MKKKWLIGIGIAILVGTMVTVSAIKGQGSAPEVEVTQLVKEELSEEVIVSGTLLPRDQESIFFQPERGELDRFQVEEGDQVKKGDPILDYKNPYTRVKASQSGTVIHVEEVPPSQAAMRPTVVIADLEKQEVRAEVSEFEALKVEKGQAVTLESDAVPEETWEGEVSRVAYLPADSDRSGNNEPVVYPITISLNEALPVKLGSRLMVVIQTKPTEADTLPQSAIVTRGDQSLVFVVEDGKVREQEVELGISDGERVQIVSGVETGEDVVVEPPQDLKNGESVIVP